MAITPDIQITMQRSQHGGSYRGKLRGRVGKIRIRGNIRPAHLKLYNTFIQLPAGFASSLITVKRSAGGELPPVAQRAVEKAVSEEFEKIMQTRDHLIDGQIGYSTPECW